MWRNFKENNWTNLALDRKPVGFKNLQKPKLRQERTKKPATIKSLQSQKRYLGFSLELRLI
jgi:hypothetical protein